MTHSLRRTGARIHSLSFAIYHKVTILGTKRQEDQRNINKQIQTHVDEWNGRDHTKGSDDDFGPTYLLIYLHETINRRKNNKHFNRLMLSFRRLPLSRRCADQLCSTLKCTKRAAKKAWGIQMLAVVGLVEKFSIKINKAKTNTSTKEKSENRKAESGKDEGKWKE